MMFLALESYSAIEHSLVTHYDCLNVFFVKP